MRKLTAARDANPVCELYLQREGAIGTLLCGHRAVRAYKVGHGENPVAPSGGQNPLSDQEREVLSVDPLSAGVTYRFDGKTLTMAIDDDLDIEEVSE